MSFSPGKSVCIMGCDIEYTPLFFSDERRIDLYLGLCPETLCPRIKGLFLFLGQHLLLDLLLGLVEFGPGRLGAALEPYGIPAVTDLEGGRGGRGGRRQLEGGLHQVGRSADARYLPLSRVA